MTTTVHVDDLPSMIGRELPPSEWILIDQKKIDLFAEAAEDPQWIHTDPERAKDGPFGTTIAHGYLTLALVIPLYERTLSVEGVRTKLNYGLNRVRFPSPVPVDSRVRVTVVVREVTDIGKGGVELVFDATVQIDGQAKPACVAQPVFRFYR